MSVTESVFGTLLNGAVVKAYTLQNASGASLTVTPYGCRILRLQMPDRNGVLGDVVLGHATLEEYLGMDFHGSFVGRYANRIGGAKMKIDGVICALDQNDGRNSLHGGRGGYHQILFAVKEITDGDSPSIEFTYTSPDGEESYPGTLEVSVKYTLTAENELVMDYRGETDKKTVFNPTNHAFFNLSGDPQKPVYDTELTIHAETITAVRDDLIPTGELLPVSGTPLDFRTAKPIGQDIRDSSPLTQLTGGYDHNFCGTGEGFREMAVAYDPESGRGVTVLSDRPGVQLYTMNTVDEGVKNRDGSQMQPHTAFCLETQFYPDSPNRPEFPFAYVEPGKPLISKTVYRFFTK